MEGAEPFDPDRLMREHPASRSADAKWPNATRTALEAAYFASLRSDEGRYPEFSIAIDESRFLSTETRMFAEAAELTPERVSQYSRVVDPRTQVLLVWEPEAGAPPRIVGIDSAEARRTERLRVPELDHPHASVVVHGPGVVALQDRGRGVSVYERGAYRSPETWRDVAIPTELTARLVELSRPGSRTMPWSLQPESMRSVDPVRWQLLQGRWIKAATSVAEHAARIWLAQLASAIARNRHGGALLHVPSSDVSPGLLSDPGTALAVPPTSPCHAPASLLGLLEYVFAVTNLEAAQDGVAVLRGQPGSGMSLDQWAIYNGAPVAYAAFRRLRDWAKATASLSGVDGAIVLDQYLSPALFGAKFTTTEVPSGVEHDHDELAKRGTRHRSMAAAVGATPGSIGVVVSQDGPITVFSNPTGKELRTQRVWM